jgi:hypothetical protein|tara:strand:+ start:718 stop:1134 length:417 start_codon:yes stop_codon:yes gene_type:complete
METNYKVVKLTNGDNIICEAVEHVNEKYIIRTPLKMEVVHDDDSGRHIESLQLTSWISPFTEDKHFEIKESHVIVITAASIGLSAYYRNIVNKQSKFSEEIVDDSIVVDDNPTDEEMFNEEYEEVLNEATNNDKPRYH